MAIAPPTVTVFGVPVSNATKGQAVALMESWIRNDDGKARAIFIVNAHTLNLAWEDSEYRAILQTGDIVFADGIGVRIAAWLKGIQLRDNLVGTDLLPLFMRAKRDRGYRYFLLGGRPGIAERAAAYLRRELPGLRVVGSHHGCFESRETGVVIDAVNGAAPDMLLVGMGNPLQEEWIHRNRAALRVPLSIGVGGLFDHWAGDLHRAPGWVRRLGMEWCQILLQQPHKWRRYLVGNPQFMSRALTDVRRPHALR